ncbi:Phosphoribulokinase uridine kinase family protein [Geosmithia morbida]|uniref:Phosphoribulokinase uridine kinase family protein n=1 Tax=Geosmithia morbida TaxID=1094350 RepID=A0A9P5CZ19_9HYPO|nr:Phosphoribulokinase uridine kinase family protein [Geosmithia morbida]KAF4119987.1 Phosphoribulokinase uridine kinase family protein [Geosmithia morbida]
MAMDGFHLTRAELDAMPDPAYARARRGAPFTFDASRYEKLVRQLREPPSKGPVLAPTFDHAVKDPVEGDLVIPETARIVIIEGLYLSLDEPVWRDARELFDEMWFVDVDADVARARLRERHLRAGIVQTLEEGDRRALENDIPNGLDIIKRRLPVDEVIVSREDGAWVHS